MAEGKIQKNPYTFRQGTNDAEFKFGHCTSDGVIDAVLIRSGWFHNHYIYIRPLSDESLSSFYNFEYFVFMRTYI